MAWVRSEYAGELAVVFTWLSALLPWSVSGVRFSGLGPTVTVVNVRFLFFQFHYLFGVAFDEQPLGQLVQLVYEIPAFVPDNQRLEGQIWLAAAAVYLVVLLLSVLFYAREDAVAERSPVDPVRFFGAALGLVAVLLAVSSALFFVHQGTVPVGTVLVGAFAVTLLRVDRT
jgi:uncharacterized protein (TIGR04206 family)